MVILFVMTLEEEKTLANKLYGEANNKYMNNRDPSDPSSFIMYLDFDNHYGHALSGAIPYSGFKWVEDKTIFTDSFIKNHNKNIERFVQTNEQLNIWENYSK